MDVAQTRRAIFYPPEGQRSTSAMSHPKSFRLWSSRRHSVRVGRLHDLNEFFDRLRSMRRTPDFFDCDGLADVLVAPGEGPDEALISTERGRLVRACLAQLPQAERQKLSWLEE